MRVLHSGYFPLLSENTRYLFLSRLILDVNEDEPKEQMDLLASDYFKNLSKKNRSCLLRRISIQRMIKGWPRAQAYQWMVSAIRLDPWELKNWAVVFTTFLPSAISKRIIVLYRGGEPQLPRINQIFNLN